MTAPLPHDPLQTLIEAVRDGQATAEQHRDLETLLRENPDARRRYVHYQLLCADLQMLLGSGAADTLLLPVDDRPAARASTGRRPRRRRIWWAAVAGAILVALAIGSRFFPLPHGERAENAEKVARPNAAVATLSAAMDAEWGNGASLPIGSPLPAAPLELRRGLAEIRFGCGAAVILQGPAAFTLESPSHLLLQRGRVAASVPAEAIGFTVRTAQATVVDLGTEFGVSSEETDVTDVHVFRGQVALAASQGAKIGRQLLGEGLAKRVEANGSRIESIRSDELAFVRTQEFEARIKALKNSPYHRWLAYSYRLRREPALVLYYTFDNQSEAFDGVLNRAGATAGKLDGRFGADARPQTRPQWVAGGRWPELRALRFDASQQQQLRVPHSKELNITQAMTIAAWVRPHTALLESNAVIASKSTLSNNHALANYELGLTRQTDSHGDVLFAVFFRSGNRRVASPPLPVAPGQWIHLAAVANGSRIVLYADGLPVAQGPGAEPSANEGDLLIGAAARDQTSDIREGGGAFEGLIGELLLVRRVLADREIAEMAAAGKQGQR